MVFLNVFVCLVWKWMNFLVFEFDDIKENWGLIEVSLVCLWKGWLDGVISFDCKDINFD